MNKFYCTYFDRNYLCRALSLFSSMNRHEKSPFTIYAICLDEISRTLLEKLAIKNVTPVSFHEIEANDQALLAAKDNRSTVEYYWTATPTIILRLLERNPQIDTLVYLDSDLFFFTDSDPIYKELGDASVLIHPHRFPDKHKHAVEAGIYNVGLLCFRRNQAGFEVLNDWREKCLEWCYRRVEEGRFGDQKYLDYWPERFKDLVVSKHDGIGTAPWNQEQYLWSADENGAPTVDGKPVIFYHFHNFKVYNAGLFTPITSYDYTLNFEILKHCFLPYMRSICESVLKIQDILPDSSIGLSEEVSISTDDTFVIHNSLLSQIGNTQFPQVPIDLDAHWKCFKGKQYKELNPLLQSERASQRSIWLSEQARIVS